MRFEELLEHWQRGSLSHDEAAVALGVSEPLLPGLAVLEGSNPGSDSVGPSILDLQRLLNVPLLARDDADAGRDQQPGGELRLACRRPPAERPGVGHPSGLGRSAHTSGTGAGHPGGIDRCFLS
jgi:hypothetical protein